MKKKKNFFFYSTKTENVNKIENGNIAMFHICTNNLKGTCQDCKN